jgi:hypothetical protein
VSPVELTEGKRGEGDGRGADSYDRKKVGPVQSIQYSLGILESKHCSSMFLGCTLMSYFVVNLETSAEMRNNFVPINDFHLVLHSISYMYIV